ncbi:NUDIX hydrolase [Pareuzebyella sediminis]|uniref:NUDIX hydrolase n=1 Tax=Pareuzebyella sediminis TaxID=2607998 RepID=UPI0011EC0544|nr:NUDIX hydrolase [Pareuzebyella sediminis]
MAISPDLELIKRIKAIADTGLVFAESGYDLERYEELKEISLNLLASMADRPLKDIRNSFLPVTEYPTPKVDVRALVLNESQEILMVRESADGKWTLPGGWADIGYSPAESVLKEVREETGLQCKVIRLLTLYDKQRHPHPPQPLYIYKLNFLCEIIGGQLQKGFDMKGAGFFNIDQLPELSEDRILAGQIKQLYRMTIENDYKVYFD